MDVPPTLAEQLQSLSCSPHPDASAAAPSDGALTDALSRLCRDLVAVVPSCLAVSIAFSRLGVEVVITTDTSGGAPHGDTEVLASLALPLPTAGLNGVLVLQASAPGAFGLLADDLVTLLGSGHRPPELDAHLVPLTASTDSALAGSLAELSVLDRALGVLIGQGWPPESAEAELHRRAAIAGLTVAAVAERLLASPSPAAPDGID